MLDVGCGWGSFAIHAATHHGVKVLGVTLSEPQVAARARARARGRASTTSSRSASPTTARSADEPFDAISSIGMVEHVGEERIDLYAEHARRAAAPGRPPAQPRDREAAGLRRPRRGRVLRAVRVPRRRAAAAVTRSAGARADRAGDDPRRGPAGRLRADHCATGSSALRRATTRRCGWRATSARASGGCTCAPPARASRPGGRRSTRCWRTSRSRRVPTDAVGRCRTNAQASPSSARRQRDPAPAPARTG